MDDDRPATATEGSVLVSNRQDLAVDEDALALLGLRSLEAEGVSDFELSVSLVGPDEMGELHERYLGEPGPTDVLSFALDDEARDGPRMLGDVVICPAVAAGNNADLEQEVRLLLVHGILHLLGHDHDEGGERAEMWAKQERYAGVAVDAAGERRSPLGGERASP